MLSHLHLIAALVLLYPTSIKLSKLYSSKTVPLWTWECVNEKCVPTKTTSPNKAQSLITCNMLCESMHLWPQPTGPVALSTTKVPVRADLFQLQIISSPSDLVREHLSKAFDLFRYDLRNLETEAFGFEEWRGVAVRVAIASNGSADPRMLLNTDESYHLSVQPKSNSLFVNISANSFCGARHGFETLSQLIWFDPYVGSLFMLESANVEDAPRFRYRGILLDTAQNYFPVNALLRTIDAMAAYKLNTFHWQATNYQAFPVLLRSVPQLYQFGAYNPEAVYTADDVRTIVHRAKLRGIRVLLEITFPSHVFKQCLDRQSLNAYCHESPYGEPNPLSSHVFDVLEGVYREILELTEVKDIFHLGGEIFDKCWSKHFNTTDLSKLWLEYIRKALQRLESANGKSPDITLLWSSNLGDRIKVDLAKYVSTIALQERSVGWAQKHISGLRTVISHEDAWDFNGGSGAWYDISDGAPYNSWQRVYEYRPWTRVGWIEGGEAMVWSSTLNADGLDSRMWPRAAALAERLWSDHPEGATRSVYARLDIHRSRLVNKGIKASPLWSMWCTHNPYTCD